jgi:hypothetical protein
MSDEHDEGADPDDRLEKLERDLQEAQAKLADQSVRLDALGRGREDSMRLLGQVRAELMLVTAERDRLQRQLTSIERMQTETIALPEDQDVGPDVHALLPSIDELMSSLHLMLNESEEHGRIRPPGGQSAELPDADWQEMIAPEVIAPEEFEDHAQASRLLVYMDLEHPIKFPLHKGVMTIGRSESASIRLSGSFVSRIHARIICSDGTTVIEDAGSRNGFKINSVAVKRHTLSHGDVIGIGRLRFTFVDTVKQD